MDLATVAIVAVIAGAIGGAVGGMLTGVVRDMARMRRGSVTYPAAPAWQLHSQSVPATSSPAAPSAASNSRRGAMGPFRLFNDRAKRALAIAQDEAIRFNHPYIGPHHLLLGLAREGEGVAGRSLNGLGLSVTGLRRAVDETIGRGERATSPAEITLSDRIKAVFTYADQERQNLGDHGIATEHLLLGLLHDDGAVSLLRTLGLERERVRMQVMATLGRMP